MDIGDHGIQLVALLVLIVVEDETEVDRGMAAVRDDREENIVAFSGRRLRVSICLIRRASTR
jgi:hypothetical protein